ERLERTWERTVRPFVRRQLHDPLEPELPLHLVDRLTRLVRDDSRKSRPQQAGRNLHYLPGVSSDFFRQIHSAPPAAAAIEARAPLFSPAWSPVPGTASFAFCLPNSLAIFQTPQPSRALRRLTIPMGLLSWASLPRWLSREDAGSRVRESVGAGPDFPGYLP